MTSSLSPIPRTAEDEVLEVFGETMILRRDPLGSPLDASVIEEIVPPGVAGPWHRHSREDEVSYVIEGTFRIWRGEEVFDIGPGGVALLPRGQAHTFQNVGPGTGRLLTVITPAGLERFFEEVAEQGLGEDDLDEVVAELRRCGQPKSGNSWTARPPRPPPSPAQCAEGLRGCQG